MRFHVFSLLLSSVIACAQTSLSPGDLAIVQYNADNPDNFSFVCLRTIDSGTRVLFTDNGWLSTDSFRNTEGLLSWEASSDLSCGDVVLIDSVGNISLSASGDQLFAFQGSLSNPQFITGINAEGAGVWQSTASSASTSSLPDSLTNGQTAIALNELDNYKYTGSFTGTVTAIATAVFVDSNFSGSNTNRQALSTGFNLSGCVFPVTWLHVEAQRLTSELEVRWTVAYEQNNQVFVILESEDGRDFKELSQVYSRGDATGTQSYFFHCAMNRGPYFKLRQVDYDGKFSESQVVVVSAKKNSFAIQQNAQECVVSSWREVDVSLLGLDGNVLSRDSGTEIHLDLRRLPAGFYLLKINSFDGVTIRKIHKYE